MTKNEVVKSVPFKKTTIDKIKQFSKQYGISGNAFVKYAVEKFIEDGGKIVLNNSKT